MITLQIHLWLQLFHRILQRHQGSRFYGRFYPIGDTISFRLRSYQGAGPTCCTSWGWKSSCFWQKEKIILSVENPFNCWLWAVFIQLTLSKSLEDKRTYNSLEMVRFHSCCHGSKRRKDILDGSVRRSFHFVECNLSKRSSS